MKRIFFSIFILLLFACSSRAQQKIEFLIGGGYVTTSTDNAKLPYWENGFQVDFSANYDIKTNTSLFVTTSFHRFSFDRDRVNRTAPDVLGYRSSVTGEGASVIELSAGSKFYKGKPGIRPYLEFSTGIMIIDQGNVSVTSWTEGSPDKTTSRYSNSGNSYILAQANLGLGVEVAVHKMKLVLDWKMVKGFGGPLYFPVTTGVKFSI